MASYQPPISHNGSVKTSFNSTDFTQTNTSPYLPITGGTLTGSLNALGITTQSFYNLPSNYTVLPSATQIGGVVSQALTTNPSSGFNTLGTLTLNTPGTYLITANIYLTPSAIITSYIVSIGDSTTFAHDLTSGIVCQTANGTTGSPLCVQVSKVVSNTSTKSFKIFGSFVFTGTATISSSSVSAIRIG